MLDTRYHLGSPALPAPQATLMAVLVKGTFGGHLPWGLLAIGADAGARGRAARLGRPGVLDRPLPADRHLRLVHLRRPDLLGPAERRQSRGPRPSLAADEKATLSLVGAHRRLPRSSGIAVAFIGVAADQASAAHPALLAPFAWIMAHLTVRSAFSLGAIEDDDPPIVPFALLALLLWRVAGKPEAR